MSSVAVLESAAELSPASEAVEAELSPPAALLVGLGTAVHGVNVLLRATVFGGANYFYTFGLEGNVVLEGLWALLPMPLVYELPLLLVLIAVPGDDPARPPGRRAKETELLAFVNCGLDRESNLEVSQ